MNKKSIILELVQMNEDEIYRILKNAWEDYIREISQIAEDIYDSCIQDYYYKYSPIYYKRHGFPEGKNLYQANAVTFDDWDVFPKFDSSELWAYYGKDGRAKRAKVLNAVMNGMRGAKFKNKANPPGWPRSWFTSYPNKFSRYQSLWSSSSRTMDGIFREFCDDIFNDTTDLLWSHVDKYV